MGPKIDQMAGDTERCHGQGDGYNDAKGIQSLIAVFMIVKKVKVKVDAGQPD